jgi:hypothetical protein
MCFVLCAAAVMSAQTPVPDPLVMANGTRVTTAAQWRDARRPELLALFTHEMYGVMPARYVRTWPCPAVVLSAAFTAAPQNIRASRTGTRIHLRISSGVLWGNQS